MKVKAVLLMGTFTLLSVVSCTMRSHTEPDIVINNALNLGQAIFVNQSSERPRGIDEIYINEGDTITLKMTTALLKQPAYQWTPDKDGVVKFVQDETDPTVFYAIALADSGAATTVELTDLGNQATRSLDVYIEKQWADPLFFRKIGQLDGHTYYISIIKRGWVEAKMFCEQVGGHLVSIQSAEENSFLLEGMPPEEEAWIGVRFEKRGNKWYVDKWVTGEPVEFKNFGDGTSDPGIFMEIYWYMNSSGKWISWHEISYAFFLEME